MTENGQTTPAQLMARLTQMRRKSLTPEQATRRQFIDRRNERLQGRGVARGPNAHPDGTFGKLKK